MLALVTARYVPLVMAELDTRTGDQIIADDLLHAAVERVMRAYDALGPGDVLVDWQLITKRESLVAHRVSYGQFFPGEIAPPPDVQLGLLHVAVQMSTDQLNDRHDPPE